MRVLHYDIETRRTLDLTEVGSYLYARHSSTDIRCLAYCLVTDGVRGPLATWQPGDPCPPMFIDVARDPEALTCVFNDAFDRQIHEQILTPRYGWPMIPLARRRCAQAAALARALPASLDGAAAALKIATRKTPAGIAMMKRLARPRGPAKKRKDAVPDFSITAEELATLVNYNQVDVVISMEIVDRIGLLPPAEQAVWQLDQIINERGVEIDLDLLETALSLAGEAKLETQAQIAELTGNVVPAAAQTQRIRQWLEQHSCKLANLRKETVADRCWSRTWNRARGSCWNSDRVPLERLLPNSPPCAGGSTHRRARASATPTDTTALRAAASVLLAHSCTI
jgi:DNA polymerase bacteriophage-type